MAVRNAAEAALSPGLPTYRGSEGRGGTPAETTVVLSSWRVFTMRPSLPLALSVLAALPLRAQVLDMADVSAPAINCVFDSDCVWPPADFADHFVLTGALGDAFLQSRTFPAGQPNTLGEGLHPYLYRINLSKLTGATALPCVLALRIPFGEPVPLDYDGDGGAEDGFVITAGVAPGVDPVSVERTGRWITIRYDGELCAGSSPGSGDSSLFVGFASQFPPSPVTAFLRDTLGSDFELEARAPAAPLLEVPVGFIRGDRDVSGRTDLSDVIGTLGHLFLGRRQAACDKAADANDDGQIDVSDPVATLSALFLGEGPLPAPFPFCGADPTPDNLTCEALSCERPACPDPSARPIRFEIVDPTGPFSARIRVTGIVENEGGPYVSGRGQQRAVLEEVPLGGRPTLLRETDFTSLAPGESIALSYERPWDASSPAEGEFPPSYRLRIEYEPDIAIDGESRNDDCDPYDNSSERSGSDINDLIAGSR